MTALRKGIEAGQSYRFNKPMIYRMVDSLAQFDPDYRGLDEIILDSSAMDASSVVCFSATKKKEDDGSGNGKFSLHPAFIDVLSQSAGFVMNANENSNLEQEVFVNHGWSSFRLYEQLSEAKKYETYVKMTAAENKEWRGDLIVLDGERPVASYKGITVRDICHLPVSKIFPDSFSLIDARCAQATAAYDLVSGEELPSCRPSAPSIS